MVTSGTDCPDVSMAFLLLVVKEGFNVFLFSFIWREE